MKYRKWCSTTTVPLPATSFPILIILILPPPPRHPRPPRHPLQWNCAALDFGYGYRHHAQQLEGPQGFRAVEKVITQTWYSLFQKIKLNQLNSEKYLRKPHKISWWDQLKSSKSEDEDISKKTHEINWNQLESKNNIFISIIGIRHVSRFDMTMNCMVLNSQRAPW